MNKVLEGMARAAWEFDDNEGCYDHLVQGDKTMRMAEQKAALLWLASNVSDEMVNVIAHATSGDEYRQRPEEDFNDWTRRLRKAAIAAALRAAAGSAPTTPEVK